MASFDLSERSIFITGHKGMVGSAILRQLSERRDIIVLTADRDSLDLTNKDAVEDWMQQHKPEVVIHAAGRVGGIGPNSKYPVEFLNENLSMAQNVINSAHSNQVRKLVFLGSSCIYPKHAEQPIQPESLLTGFIEPSNEAYALAKIVGVRLCKYYREEYGADFISVMPCNLYGEGDHYDAFLSHVVPALILKMHNAKVFEHERIKLWGSGQVLREFLYVDDLARGVLLALEEYSDRHPLNIGYGAEIAIQELAKTIADVIGYNGQIEFDYENPDGVPRKLLDSSVIQNMGWAADINLSEGVRKAYDDFLARDIEQKM